jgi:uncharacterized membrane protein
MTPRLYALWEALSSSFWFVPTLMAFGAVGLSFVTLAIDNSYIGRDLVTSVPWLWSGDADGARSLLSTVGSSMVTVAGTVFSITIAALTLASSQFGPRLLRNFTRDTGNQIVLGTFISTFLYCLLILRTVRTNKDGSGFIPYLSISCGTLLAIASLGVLIYFIDHVASSIQAESLVASIGAELKADIARLCPAERTGPDDIKASPPENPTHTVKATTSGYIQSLDHDALLEVAAEKGMLIQVRHRPGDFILSGETLLNVWAEDDPPSDRLRNSFTVGARRTPVQDIRYGVRQLTEIAARALSPGINDPFTAIGCTDWLFDGLTAMARCHSLPSAHRDENGRILLLEDPIDFAELVGLSISPIRHYGADSPMVIDHLLQVMVRLADLVEDPGHRAALLLEIQQTRSMTDRAAAA